MNKIITSNLTMNISKTTPTIAYKTPHRPIRRRTIKSTIDPTVTSSDEDDTASAHESDLDSPLAVPLLWSPRGKMTPRALLRRLEEAASSEDSTGTMERPRSPCYGYVGTSEEDEDVPPAEYEAATVDCYWQYPMVDPENSCYGCRIQHPSQFQHMGHPGACMGGGDSTPPYSSPRGEKRERSPSPCLPRKHLLAPSTDGEDGDDEEEEEEDVCVFATETPEKVAGDCVVVKGTVCVPDTPEKELPPTDTVPAQLTEAGEDIGGWSASLESMCSQCSRICPREMSLWCQ